MPVNDLERQAKSPATGPDAGNQSVVDYNLKVDGVLYIPTGETNTLNGGKDQVGAIRVTDGKLNVYAGNDIWIEYVSTEDIADLSPVKSVNGRTGDVVGLAEQSSLESEISRATAAESAISANLSAETNRAIAVENNKADKSSITNALKIPYSALDPSKTTYTNINYANREVVLFDTTSGGILGFFTFSSGGVLTLGFTADPSFIGLIVGTLGDLTNYLTVSQGISLIEDGVNYNRLRGTLTQSAYSTTGSPIANTHTLSDGSLGKVFTAISTPLDSRKTFFDNGVPFVLAEGQSVFFYFKITSFISATPAFGFGFGTLSAPYTYVIRRDGSVLGLNLLGVDTIQVANPNYAITLNVWCYMEAQRIEGGVYRFRFNNGTNTMPWITMAVAPTGNQLIGIRGGINGEGYYSQSLVFANTEELKDYTDFEVLKAKERRNSTTPRGLMTEGYDPIGSKFRLQSGRDFAGEGQFVGAATTATISIQNASASDVYHVTPIATPELIAVTAQTNQVTFARNIGGINDLKFNWTRLAKDACVQRFEWRVKNANHPTTLVGQWTVTPDIDPETGVTTACTGLSYNERTQEILVAYYNYAVKSQIHTFRKENLTPYSPSGTIIPVPNRIIDLTDKIDHIQGIAWDKRTGFYYAFGTIKGMPLDDANRVLICVNDAGERMKEDWFPDFQCEPGMISIYNGKIYFKPNDYNWLKSYDIDTKQQIGQGYYQNNAFSREGMGTGSRTGNIYLVDDAGNGTKFDNNMSVLYTFTLTNIGNEQEGLFEHPADESVWVTADAFTHGGFPNGNCLYQYDLNQKYGKDMVMPDMFGGWESAVIPRSVQIFNGNIYGTGDVDLPIVDLNGMPDFMTNIPTVTKDGRTVTFRYRGSNTAPTTTVDNNFFLPCYKSGWGATVPSNYSSILASFRYIQVQLRIS